MINPFLVLFAIALPLLVLAWLARIYPRPVLALVVMVPALLSIGVVYMERDLAWTGVLPIFFFDATVLLITVIDALSIPKRDRFSLERQTGRIVSLGKPHRLRIVVSHVANRAHSVWIRDDVDELLNPEPGEFALRLEPRSLTTLHYDIRPVQRGAFELDAIFLRVRSRFGLWQRFYDYPDKVTIRVYPDMKQLSEYAVLARTNRLNLLGVRRTRQIGQDNEFERLRDYTRDDNYKHIDWRTTARRRKLTVKDFQANQSQRIVFLVDCGRMMTNEVGGLSLLDHSLNAMLMLSYVALRQGDSVGLVCFADEVRNYVPLRGGMSQMNHLLHASYDRFPELVESRYDRAFLYLSSHCRRRALVILISNLIDEVNARQVEQYLSSLSGKHLPLGVMLRDHRLFDAVADERPQGAQLYRAAAAAGILSWRQQVLHDLERKGAMTVDAFAEDLAAPLVNRYLEIKARHLL